MFASLKNRDRKFKSVISSNAERVYKLMKKRKGEKE